MLKRAVSLGKRRTTDKQLGTDLDLSYLSTQLVAMGFPCQKLPKTLYRNSMKQTLKFLDAKHGAQYHVFNLCSEPGWIYPSTCFHGQCSQFPFDDHTPPPFLLLLTILHRVHSWISAHPSNVAVVHCKAGKGRTGVVCCAYLLLSGAYATTDDTLTAYTRIRMQEGWGDGLTVKSQILYVRYIEAFIRMLSGAGQFALERVLENDASMTQSKLYTLADGKLRFRMHKTRPFDTYNPVARRVSSITLHGFQVVEATIEIDQTDTLVYSSTNGTRTKQTEDARSVCTFSPVHDLFLEGDICTRIYTKRRRLCSFWFNTFFLGTFVHEDADSVQFTAKDVDGWKRGSGLDEYCFRVSINFERRVE